MPLEPLAHAQANYQVRMEWGEAGLARLAPAHVVVVVHTLGLSARGIAAAEAGERLDLTAPTDAADAAAARLVRAAGDTGAEVLVGGIRNAAAVAAHVLEVQRARADRTSIAIIAAGDADAGALRFAVDDLLGAGAIVCALGDLGIDHASPDAAVAGEGFRALRGATRHLLSASGTGRALAAQGLGDRVHESAARDASSVVPVLRAGVLAAV